MEGNNKYYLKVERDLYYDPIWSKDEDLIDTNSTSYITVYGYNSNLSKEEVVKQIYDFLREDILNLAFNNRKSVNDFIKKYKVTIYRYDNFTDHNRYFLNKVIEMRYCSSKEVAGRIRYTLVPKGYILLTNYYET